MLEKAVQKAAEPFGFDPMVIIGIVEAILALFENCPERNSAAQRMKNPGIVGRARLRRELRRTFESDDCCRPHRSQVSALADALEAQCRNMDAADLDSCAAEILG